MYRLTSVKAVVGLEMVSAIVGAVNAYLFAAIIGPHVPKELDVYANTTALTLGVVWLFFSTYILFRCDEETKKVAEAIDEEDEAKFLKEASKRLSPAYWLIYAEVSLLTLVGFDLFHVDPESRIFAIVINFLISFVVSTTVWVAWDADDSLQGIVVVYNVQKIKKEWLARLKEILGK